MAKIVIFLCCVVVGSTIAKPANNEQLDKATANDVAVNTVVAAEKKADLVSGQQQADKKEGSTVNIQGVTTGLDPLLISYDKGPTTPFKPQRAGTMFARFIDDIFQIPITALTSVARFITNPFTEANKKPEVAIATS